MLDEDEFKEVHQLYHDAFRSLKASEQGRDGATPPSVIDARLAPVRDAYFRMTGYRETNAAAILHHALSLYGPSCKNCSRPLRTPRARYCAACGVDAVEAAVPKDAGLRERHDP